MGAKLGSDIRSETKLVNFCKLGELGVRDEGRCAVFKLCFKATTTTKIYKTTIYKQGASNINLNNNKTMPT